jgi:AsmA protein
MTGYSADLDLAGATARFDGRIGGAPLTAEGSVALAASGLSAPFAALGLPAPDLPAGFGRDRLALDAALTWDGATLFLRDLAAALDGTRVTGALDIATVGATAGPRPRITADLAAGPLLLPSGETGGGNAGNSAATGAGWSTAPIDVSALGLADATIALRAESIQAGALRVGPARLLARLDDRRLVVDIAELGVAGGSVTGQAVVNGRGGISASADLAAAGVALQPLLAAAAGYDRLIATGEGRVRILSSGATVDALVRGLSGEGRLALGQGELRGLDLAGMVRSLDPGYVGAGQKTIFDSVTASFVLDGGVLANDDLAFAAPLLRAEGKGRVDLGARRLDYRLVPTALPGADGSGGVRVPVLITGPWAAPRIALDLEALAEERLKIEEEKVRAAAEAALKARAAEIGIAPVEGQSLEDAARQKLEDRAEDVLKREGDKLLRGLLGGN